MRVRVGGELIEQRIRTEAALFAAVLGDRSRAQIFIEILSAAMTVGVLLRGRVGGHHVKREASRFIPSTLTLFAVTTTASTFGPGEALRRGRATL